MTKQEIIERFREKFHRYTEDDPRDVMLDTMSGGIEDFFLSLRDEELKELKDICNRCRTERGLATAIGNYIHKRME